MSGEQIICKKSSGESQIDRDNVGQKLATGQPYQRLHVIRKGGSKIELNHAHK